MYYKNMRTREETRSSAIWRTLARRQEPSALVREQSRRNAPG